jgi:hypothetical protein
MSLGVTVQTSNPGSPIAPEAAPVPPTFDWLPNWAGRTVIVLASGPSANDVDLTLAKDRAHIMAVNESWRLAPWCDVLYGCDARWWKSRHGVPRFKGLKISQDKRTAELFPEIRRVHSIKGVNQFRFDNLGYIGWFGNGGMQAVNLAAQLKPARLILVGLDLTTANGAHWHGAHTNNLPNPRDHIVDRWRWMMDGQKEAFEAQGIEVINASFRSALTRYEKRELSKCL